MTCFGYLVAGVLKVFGKCPTIICGKEGCETQPALVMKSESIFNGMVSLSALRIFGWRPLSENSSSGSLSTAPASLVRPLKDENPLFPGRPACAPFSHPLLAWLSNHGLPRICVLEIVLDEVCRLDGSRFLVRRSHIQRQLGLSGVGIGPQPGLVKANMQAVRVVPDNHAVPGNLEEKRAVVCGEDTCVTRRRPLSPEAVAPSPVVVIGPKIYMIRLECCGWVESPNASQDLMGINQ